MDNGEKEYIEALNCLENDQFELAKELFMQSANKGYAEGQFAVASFYYKGECNFDKDMEEFEKWAKLAADQNHADACESLGNIYFDKNSSIYNVKAAAYYLEKALHLENYQASGKLGLIYLIDKNYDLAKQHFEIAINNNYPIGYYGMGLMYESQNIDDKALLYYKEAKENGYVGKAIEDALERVQVTGAVIDHVKGGASKFTRAVIVTIIFYIVYYVLKRLNP